MNKRMMKVAVYYRNDDVRIQEVPVPEIGPGELLMRIEASGICGSDVMEWYRVRKAPLVLGHEVAGVVEEAGEGVREFKKGDRIVAAHHVPCNTCKYCLRGHHSVCDTLRSTNFDPGGFAQYVRLPRINVDRGVFRLPDELSFEEGTFVEPLACVLRGQRIAGLRPGESLFVIGSGISGLLHIAAAKALGAGRILATDINPQRLHFAKMMGADEVFLSEGELSEKLKKANGGLGADFVAVCTAAAPAIRSAFKCADRGGRILFFAPAMPGETFPFPLYELWRDGVSIHFSYAGPPADMMAALELLRSRRILVGGMVTHRLPLSETARGFELVAKAQSSVKVIIRPHG
ncbi:MAG: alcohol dehydrogenase catalytic domain-containing protein [Thermoplasmata archaeon]